MKRILPLAASLLLVTTFAAAGNYLGPDRHKWVREPTQDYVRLQYVTGYNPYNVQICTLNNLCTLIPSREQQHYWCSGTYVLYPGGYCITHPADCWQGHIIETHCAYAEINLPEASVHGSFACAQTGNNGWCRGGPTVSFTASEPLASERITFLEGSQGSGDLTLCDPPDAAEVTCSWTPPEGENSLSFWAHSTYGDTSRMANLSCKVDTENPSVSLSISGSPNANGWYRNSPTITAAGADSASGVAGLFVQLDGGALQPSPYTLLAEGVFAVRGVAADHAGNLANTPDHPLRVDKTPPYEYDFLPSRPPDEVGLWYLAPVTVDVVGRDALSGFEYASYLWYGAAGFTQAGIFPLTVDREGYNDINPCAYDRAGMSLCGSEFIQLDLTAPTASPLISGVFGLNDWYISPVELDVNAADAGAGVCARSVNVDQSTWKDAPLTFADQGEHAFAVQARDCVNRYSPISAAVDFKIDTVSPNLTALIPLPSGQNGWHVTPVVVALSGDDVTSGVMLAQVQVNGGNWHAGEVTVAQEGVNELAFRVQDHAGNLATGAASLSVDLSDPLLEVAASGTAGLADWYVSPLVLSAAAADAVSGVHTLQAHVVGQPWLTQDGLTLAEDGELQVEFRAVDHAGRTTTTLLTPKIDQTPPTLDPLVTGPLGLDNWYIGPVTLQAKAEDATSGVAAVLPAAALSVTEDGYHQVDWTAQDAAGNRVTGSSTFQIDQTPPAITLDPVADVWTGAVTISGQAADSLSGLAAVEVSTSLGLLWQAAAVLPDGGWFLPIDTLRLAGGQRLILVRAYDQAGNVALAQVEVTIANRPPAISLSARWYIWESGELTIQAGDVPYERVTVEICDAQGRWPCTVMTFGAHNTPHWVSWDRHFGSIVAPIGEYPVTATVTDILGRSAAAGGLILIPQPWTATPTATLPAAQTAAPAPTQTGTPQPTATAASQATQEGISARPTLVITPEAVTPAAQGLEETPAIGSYLVLIGLCAVLGAAVSRDRRPKEWKRLGKVLNQLISIEKGEQ